MLKIRRAARKFDLQSLLLLGVSVHCASLLRCSGTTHLLVLEVYTLLQLPTQSVAAVSTCCLPLVPRLLLDGTLWSSHPEAKLPHGIWVPLLSLSVLQLVAERMVCIAGFACKLRRWIQSIRNRMTKLKKKEFTHVVVKKKRRPDGSIAVPEP